MLDVFLDQGGTLVIDRVMPWVLYGVLSGSAAYSETLGVKVNGACVGGASGGQALFLAVAN